MAGAVAGMCWDWQENDGRAYFFPLTNCSIFYVPVTRLVQNQKVWLVEQCNSSGQQKQINRSKIQQLYKYQMSKNKQEKLMSRLNWTFQEEEYLRTLKEINEIKSWTAISNELNKAFEGKSRSGKQCRERYMNYVRFAGLSDNSSKWTLAQDEILFQNFLIHGRKWVEICKEMKGKSQNCLKNRFYGAMRKISRRIAKIFKQKKLKQKKNLKQQIFIKILESSEKNSSPCGDSDSNELLLKLKEDLIQLAIVPEQELIIEEVVSLANRIHEYISLSKVHYSQIRAQNEARKMGEECENKLSCKISSTSQEEEIRVSIFSPIETLNCWKQAYDEQTANKFEQKSYLFELGLELENINVSISNDLEREANQILNIEFVEQNLQIF